MTPHTITVQEDIATRTDSNGESESQRYEYSPNSNGRLYLFRRTRKGWRTKDKHGLLIGHRNAYHDFSF